MICWNLKTIGFPVIIPCNLAKAIIEPEKVMAPTTSPTDISIALISFILFPAKIPNFSGARKAPVATNTAAKPTKL